MRAAKQDKRKCGPQEVIRAKKQEQPRPECLKSYVSEKRGGKEKKKDVRKLRRLRTRRGVG